MLPQSMGKREQGNIRLPLKITDPCNSSTPCTPRNPLDFTLGQQRGEQAEH